MQAPRALIANTALSSVILIRESSCQKSFSCSVIFYVPSQNRRLAYYELFQDASARTRHFSGKLEMHNLKTVVNKMLDHILV